MPIEDFLEDFEISEVSNEDNKHLDKPYYLNYFENKITGLTFEKFGERFLGTVTPSLIIAPVCDEKVKDFVSFLKEKESFKEIAFESHFSSKNEEIIDGSLLGRGEGGEAIYCFINRANPFSFEEDVSFVFADPLLKNEVLRLISTMTPFQIKKKKKESNIYILKSGFSGSLQLKNFKISCPKVSPELHYDSSFPEKHEKIVARLSDPERKKGLFMFSGDPGTGKTNYIRYLTSLVDRKFVFIPPFMVGDLSGPSLVSLMTDHPNSVLIIEDAEKSIVKRDGYTSDSDVSTILNLSDGFLSDVLNCSIILTFNCPDSDIDEALLRKGRLTINHRFEKLSVDKLEKLAKEEGKNLKFDKPLSLAEYYNLDWDTGIKKKEERKIGFGQ